MYVHNSSSQYRLSDVCRIYVWQFNIGIILSYYIDSGSSMWFTVFTTKQVLHTFSCETYCRSVRLLYWIWNNLILFCILSFLLYIIFIYNFYYIYNNTWSKKFGPLFTKIEQAEEYEILLTCSIYVKIQTANIIFLNYTYWIY